MSSKKSVGSRKSLDFPQGNDLLVIVVGVHKDLFQLAAEVLDLIRVLGEAGLRALGPPDIALQT
eukprot:399711-Alexandrium_andersonii.AAC.1